MSSKITVANEQGAVAGGDLFGDTTVGNTVVLVIGILKEEEYTKAVDPYTGTEELKVKYL